MAEQNIFQPGEWKSPVQTMNGYKIFCKTCGKTSVKSALRVYHRGHDVEWVKK